MKLQKDFGSVYMRFFFFGLQLEAAAELSIFSCHSLTPEVVNTPLLIQTKIKPCPVPSALPSSSTGVCGSASQSDGAIITHHDSEWKSGSTQLAHCTVSALGHREGMDA